MVQTGTRQSRPTIEGGSWVGWKPGLRHREPASHPAADSENPRAPTHDDEGCSSKAGHRPIRRGPPAPDRMAVRRDCCETQPARSGSGRMRAPSGSLGGGRRPGVSARAVGARPGHITARSGSLMRGSGRSPRVEARTERQQVLRSQEFADNWLRSAPGSRVRSAPGSLACVGRGDWEFGRRIGPPPRTHPGPKLTHAPEGGLPCIRGPGSAIVGIARDVTSEARSRNRRDPC